MIYSSLTNEWLFVKPSKSDFLHNVILSFDKVTNVSKILLRFLNSIARAHVESFEQKFEATNLQPPIA